MNVRNKNKKNANEIINGYNDAIQFLLDENMRFTILSCRVWIKLYTEKDAIKLLKYLFTHHRKFYYALAVMGCKSHAMKNKIFYESNDNDEILYYYLYE